MIKKWQKRVVSLASKLGFKDKMKQGSLSADDQKTLFSEYEKEYGISFTADRDANEDADPEPEPAPVISVEDQQQLASLLGESAPQTVQGMTQVIVDQQQQIQVLGNQSEPSGPIGTTTVNGVVASTIATTLGHTAHTSTHLFGIEHPMMSRDQWFVDLTISKKAVVEKIGEDQQIAFENAFKTFGRAIVSRSAELQEKNMVGLLDYKKMIAGESNIDYTELMGTAGEYIVRRTDLILAYLRSLPSVSDIFPMRSGIQNLEIASGANFGELSQGYRSGRIFKGNVKFTAEIYRIADVMFKFLFSDLISLEKQYIGYLNKEGSDVIKWTFIEWIMVHFGQILKNEQNRRRVVGTRTPQQNVISNPAMLAADGIYQAVDRIEEELKVYPNPEFGIYTESTIVEYFQSFWDFYSQTLDSLLGYVIFANAKHKPWYVRNFRKLYGRETDFTGVTPNTISDVDANIIWVPNLPMNNYKLILAQPGNLENHEDKPNEMFNFYFERQWEDVATMSRWKEGAGAQQAGIQYKTLEELKEAGYINQWIFTNDPVTELEPDASVIDGKTNTYFRTGENTSPTKITDIKNFSIERVYKIICGDTTSATEIAATGKFAKISADWKPKEKGDFIVLYAELADVDDENGGEIVKVTKPTGNFLELKRRVS